FSLCVSRDGSLWIAFTTTPNVFHVHDGHVDSYTPRDGPPAGFPRGILADARGAVWSSGTRGHARFRDAKWDRFFTQHGLGEGAVDAMYEDHSGELWIVSAAGVFRRRSESDSFDRLSTIPDFRAFAEDPKGAMWATGRLTLLGSPDRAPSKPLPG